MIRHHHQPIGKVAFQAAVRHLDQLILHALVSADPDNSGRPPLSHGGDEDSKRLLGKGHIAVVVLWHDHLQRRSDKL